MIDSVEIMDKVKVIKPLSQTAHQVLGLVSRKRRDPQEICDVIEKDPALTADVLRFVNSSQFNLQRELLTVKEAVSYLGETRIVGIALAAAGKDFFNSDLAGYHGSRGDLGKHSLYAAIAARELAGYTFGKVEPGVAYTAGLLHDIGKVTISDFLEGATDSILNELDQETAGTFLEAEKKYLGADHCEVGYEMANQWEIPHLLTVGIKHHHMPIDADPEDQAMAYVVHVADMLAMNMGICSEADCLNYKFDATYTDVMKLDGRQLEKLTLKIQKEWEETSAQMFSKSKT